MTGASGFADPASDADLVAGVLAGDRDAFAQVYDKYADRLHDFAFSMLRQREDAMDAVADAFVTMAERLDQLRDPARLRPWLYAVVRRECLHRLKQRSRTTYDGEDDLLDLPDQAASPETMAEQRVLQALVWDAAAGLNERDQAMLDLHLRQGLDGAELGEAMGMTPENAYVSLSRLRDQVERSIGALLVARTSNHTCADLDDVLGEWQGEYTPLVRKRVARHVDKCAACTRRRALVASPAALLAGVPAFAAPAMLRDRVLEDSRLVSALSVRSGGGSGDGGVPPSGTGEPDDRRRRRVTVLGTVAAVLVILLGVGLWQTTDDEPTDLVADSPSGLTPPTSPEQTPSTQPTTELTSGPASPSSTPSESPTLEVSESPSATTTQAATETPTESPTETVSSETPTEEPSQSPTVAPPGRLSVSPRSLDLGAAGTRSITLTNSGGSPVAFTVSAAQGWLSVSPSSGTLKPGQSRPVTVGAERAGLPEGTTSGQVTVGWDKGTVPVAVTASRNSGPVIGALNPLQADCDAPVTLTVPISDESGIASASVAWTGSSTGSKALTRRGAVYYANIGTIAVGTIQLTVTGTDTLGNESRRTASFVVNPCPQ
jgi:RNA polymerase sigma factor (sigma-70 family)